MIKQTKRTYESPVAEEIRVFMEINFLASIDGGEKPVDDSNEGDTSGWGPWN